LDGFFACLDAATFPGSDCLERNAMSITTAILDFDGTLASSLEGIHECFQEALSGLGYASPSLEAVRQTEGLTLEESVRRLTKDHCDGARLGEVVDCYRALYAEKGRAMATLLPRAKDALTAIRGMGVRIVLVSNKSHKGLLHLAEHLGIDACVDMTLGVDDQSFRKPDPQLYTESIATRLPAPPGRQVLVIGDTECDILFAKNAGLRSCWASYGYGDELACKSLLPEFILPDIVQLPGLIHTLSD
jgi:phosphoglycolate phosphatase